MEHVYTQPQYGEDWFDYQNLYSEFVNACPSDGVIVEVGSWKGRSTIYLAVEVFNSGKDIKVFAVDTWLGQLDLDIHQNDSYVKNGSLYDLFVSNMKVVNDQKSIVFPIKNESIKAAASFADESLDIVYIDASHNYEDVKADIKAWLPKVKKGGILSGHDYGWEGVNRAVNELLPNNFEVKKYYGECWVHYKKI
jgi:cephalosporin hydroxylase